MKKLTMSEMKPTVGNDERRTAPNRSRTLAFAAAGALGLIALTRPAPASAQEAEAAPAADTSAGTEASDGTKTRRIEPGGANAPAAEQPAEAAAAEPAAKDEAPAPATVEGQATASTKVTLAETEVGSPAAKVPLADFQAAFERITHTRFGLAAPDFSKTLVRPILPREGAVITRDAGNGLSTDIPNRGVVMGDVGVSVAAPFVTFFRPDTKATILYAKGGIDVYALRASGLGEYADGSTRLGWPVDSRGMFQGGEGSAYRGNVEFHALFLSMPELAGNASACDSATGWDLSVRFGGGHSSLNTKLPYNRAGSLGNIPVSDGAWSFEVGGELAHPNYAGAPSAIRFEAVGVNATAGTEVVDAYAAVSGNFSRYARLLLVPRFQDVLGNMGPQGELKFEALPVSMVTVGAGFIGGYTFQKSGGNTGLLAGYGEATVGGATHSLKRAAAVIRVGYAAEIGGSEFNRIPNTPFVWLGFSAPLGMSGNEVK
jgi:hypothetical protein